MTNQRINSVEKLFRAREKILLLIAYFASSIFIVLFLLSTETRSESNNEELRIRNIQGVLEIIMRETTSGNRENLSRLFWTNGFTSKRAAKGMAIFLSFDKPYKDSELKSHGMISSSAGTTFLYCISVEVDQKCAAFHFVDISQDLDFKTLIVAENIDELRGNLKIYDVKSLKFHSLE